MANAYILVVVGILLAKVGGFLRDGFFARIFGAGTETDIYLQIFGVASLIFTAVGSALSTLVIKNVNKTKYDEKGQNRYAAHFIRSISLLVGAVTVVLYIFAEPVVRYLLPGIEGENLALALRIMYIMLPSFLFISVAYMMSGLLQNRRVFFTPSVMSLPYNLIVIGALVLKNAGVIDVDIELISIITTLGWFLHIVILMPDFYRKGYRFFASSEGIVKSGGMSNLLETAFIFVSGLMFQLCILFDKGDAFGDDGMLTNINFGSSLFITFSGVFVVAMSSVVFPAISQNYEHGEMKYVRELVRYMIKLMAAIFAFYLVAVVFFGDFAVSVIYEGGSFTHENALCVTWAFIIYSFGIFGYLAQNIINKLFYLAGKYAVTVWGAVIIVVLNVVIDNVFAPYFGVYFAPVTTTVLISLYAIFVLIRLKSVIGSYINKELGIMLVKILASAVVCVLSIVLLKNVLPDAFVSGGGWERVVTFGIGAAVYIVSLVATGVIKDLFTTPISKIK